MIIYCVPSLGDNLPIRVTKFPTNPTHQIMLPSLCIGHAQIILNEIKFQVLQVQGLKYNVTFSLHVLGLRYYRLIKLLDYIDFMGPFQASSFYFHGPLQFLSRQACRIHIQLMGHAFAQYCVHWDSRYRQVKQPQLTHHLYLLAFNILSSGHTLSHKCTSMCYLSGTMGDLNQGG